MSLKDAVAAFNAAVARVITTEPSTVKAKNAEQMTGGVTATTIRSQITKADCKLGLVVNKPAPAEIGTYPESAEHYAGSASIARWIASLLAPFEKKQTVGDFLVVKTANRAWDLDVRPSVGSQFTAVVYGATEVAAVKGSAKYLTIIDTEAKVVWTRSAAGQPWVETVDDWTRHVSPNRWYSNTTTGWLLYINDRYDVTLF